jgi:nucleotide-binding universal stress UspA family protein
MGERSTVVVGVDGSPESRVALRGADLLVLGHRGRGGFASAVLGSVGLHCVLHALCPVTIVRPEREPAEAPRVADADPVFAPTY